VVSRSRSVLLVMHDLRPGNICTCSVTGRGLAPFMSINPRSGNYEPFSNAWVLVASVRQVQRIGLSAHTDHRAAGA